MRNATDKMNNIFKRMITSASKALIKLF